MTFASLACILLGKISSDASWGWSQDPGPPRSGEFPRYLFLRIYYKMAKSTLSIFIDESGDFGKYEPHADKYVVGLVFHDQNNDISSNISNFESHLKNLGHTQHAVHTGPLIRREQYYENDLMEDRIKLFSSLFNCVRKLPIQYAHILISKKEYPDAMKLNSRISKELGQLLTDKADFFNKYDEVVIYYDNGQTDLTHIINAVFSSRLTSVDIRKVRPVDYLLFQAADLVCTMELLANKLEDKSFTKSELDFFKTHRDFKKNYLKWLRAKHL